MQVDIMRRLNSISYIQVVCHNNKYAMKHIKGLSMLQVMLTLLHHTREAGGPNRIT
jgi:hypothetical protein